MKYPGAYLVALVMALVAPKLIRLDTYGTNVEMENLLGRMVISLLFMFPLMVAWPLMKQINASFDKRVAIIGQLIALIVWICFYFSLPQDLTTMFWSYESRMVLSLIFAWCIPFVWIVHATHYNSNLIWKRSQKCIIKWAIAVISSVIVWWWILISITSIGYLFGISINDIIYPQVWSVVFSLLFPTILLIGIQDKTEDFDYPKLFRFFWLYVFLPLTILYALILLVYIFQIMIQGELPRWIVTRMVIWYTVFGTAWYLLTYPLRSDHSWLRNVHRYYFITLILFAVLLFVAMGVRIQQYWRTTPRYLIVMMGIRIIIISWISLWKSERSLSTIIIAFTVLLFLSTYGPQSAVHLPTRLQYNQMVALLQTNNFLEDGTIVARTVDLDNDRYLSWDIEKIYQRAIYLAEENGPEVFKTLYAGTWFEQLSWTIAGAVAEQFMASLGVSNFFVKDINDTIDNSINYVWPRYIFPINIVGYTTLMHLSTYDKIPSPDTQITFEWNDKGKVLITVWAKTYNVNLYEYSDIIRQASSSPTWKSLEINGDDYKMIITDLYWKLQDDGNYTIVDYNSYLLLK